MPMGKAWERKGTNKNGVPLCVQLLTHTICSELMTSIWSRYVNFSNLDEL